MQSYVLGFCFSRDHGKVVLIAKTKPPWQAGRLNGVGGRVEPGETPAQAVAREFREESQCGDTLDWEPFGRLRGGDWEVWLFHAHYQCLPIYNVSPEGTVSVHHTLVVLTKPTSQGHAPLPNLRYLIPMALNHFSTDYRNEFLEILETTCPLATDTSSGALAGSIERESPQPLHLPSLGPEPATVGEWVEQSRRTGILEFPLLNSISSKIAGGHDARCAVLKPAPDGGPSQAPCNCRKLTGAPECTGISATWCPVHGDCTCDRRETETSSEECPLHSRSSTHAERTSPTEQREVVGVPPRDLDTEAVQREVSAYLNVRLPDLKGPRRHPAVARPRMVAMYLSRKLTTASFPEIGKCFGGRDHSTVISAVRKIERLLAQDSRLRDVVNLLEGRLRLLNVETAPTGQLTPGTP